MPRKKQARRKKLCSRPPYKLRFRDELEAKMALALWAGKKGVVRVYGPCEFCAGWHTTSQRRR